MFKKMINQGLNPSQYDGLTKVASRGYMIGSIDESGAFSFSSNPVMHSTLQSAIDEVDRLAKLKPGIAYFYVQCHGGRMVPKAVSFVTF